MWQAVYIVRVLCRCVDVVYFYIHSRTHYSRKSAPSLQFMSHPIMLGLAHCETALAGPHWRLIRL